MDLNSFSYEENDRRYINPQVALDESNQFIDNLRSAQQQDTAQIQQDTYDLGTEVPSNLGGLVGGEGYFKSRYQTPQTSSIVADLRTAAQAQALNEAMSNELAKAKQRYNNAYRAASKRGKGGGSGGGDSTDPTSGLPENVTEEGVEGVNEMTSIWNTGIGDDFVTYGLYKLNRNPGEDEGTWKKRSQDWIKEMDMKEHWRAN